MHHAEPIDWASIEGVFTDVDDTLTQHGRLESDTYEALWALKKAGLKIIPVTGRSAGWAHLMMMQWPIDAVIAESGALWFHRKRVTGSTQEKIQVDFFNDNAQMGRRDLLTLCEQLISEHPPLRFASDNQFRLVDVAIDYNEEVKVPESVVRDVQNKIRAKGFQARASSIHINAWNGQFDKAPAAIKLLGSQFSSHADLDKWIFVGDAPNDESMFATFPNSVGVANIRGAIQSGQLKKLPRYLTKAAFGQGFVELAQKLLAYKTR
jgi:HAD superfamily hydrolase (TIGR01484 family)